MKRWMIISVAAVMCVGGAIADAGAAGIINGSFEDDGRIRVRDVNDPNGWSVDLRTQLFERYVYTDWATEGFYNLSLNSKLAVFNGGETAKATQTVDFSGAEKLLFDVKLDTGLFGAWDPCTATVMVTIDDEVIWQNPAGADNVSGEYFAQEYMLSDEQRSGEHELAMVLRIDASGWIENYITQWDNFELVYYCNGGGLLPGDFNRDCFVDMNDVRLLAEVWAADGVGTGDARNMYNGDDIEGMAFINFYDLAAMLETWVDMSDVQALAEVWLSNQVARDDPRNAYKGDDIEDEAVINFYDMVLMLETWLENSWLEEEPVEGQ